MDADVVIVGAGLSGLRCAIRLEELGHTVVVVEAEDVVGGRLRTDVVDGFQCDRGFAVMIPAYPAIKKWVDLDALDFHTFGAGVLVRRENRCTVLADPVREPQWLLRSLRSGYVHPMELAALGAWVAPVMTSVRKVIAGPDTTWAASFDNAGFTGALRREVIDVFLAGVVADSHGETSATYVKILTRMFALSRPGLPGKGIGAFPGQLATKLTGQVRLGESVERLEQDAGGWAVHTSAGTLTSRAAVLATSPQRVPDFVDLPAPRMNGLVTWWFEAGDRPAEGDLPLLAIDGRRSMVDPPGPVWNAAFVSTAIPSYAPAGRHLVEATTLLDRPDGRATEAEVLAHLSQIYGCSTQSWRTIARYEVPNALPATPPPLKPRKRIDLGDGRYLCGDHRDTSSQQGALVSGNRTAEAVHRRLSSG